MKDFRDIVSRSVKLLEDDVDTDQMIPARFLRTSESEGLGRFLFFDRRFSKDGHENAAFPLSQDRYQGESILVAGANFGCGSSREHAPWALKDFGFRVIMARSFADIFYSNCLMNGLLPIALDDEAYELLSQETGSLTVSLRDDSIRAHDCMIPFSIDPFSKYCLMHGINELDFIVQNEPAIQNFETSRGERIRSLAVQ